MKSQESYHTFIFVFCNVRKCLAGLNGGVELPWLHTREASATARLKTLTSLEQKCCLLTQQYKHYWGEDEERIFVLKATFLDQ